LFGFFILKVILSGSV